MQGWLDQLKEQQAGWLARATHVLQHGGITPKDLEELLADAEQYLWGEGDGVAVQQAQLQLQDCKDWADRVAKCLRQKATVEVSHLLLVSRHVLTFPASWSCACMGTPLTRQMPLSNEEFELSLR